MDIKEIAEVIELFKNSQLSKLTVKDGKKEIYLESAQGAAPFIREFSGMKELSDVNLENTIDAPMVGSFYRAPSSDAKPFVEAGDLVKKGDVLCIIEAMKVMNEIKAKTDGLIKEIKVEDGAAVEFGKPLFVVE